MENKLLEKIQAFYFITVAVLMYYFINEILNLGVFVTYRHAFALLLAASAFFSFLVKPNIARAAAAVKPALIYSVPLLITIVVSLFIWFEGQVDVVVIFRGLSGAFIYVNMLSFAFAAAAFLYIFGEKGIWYNLIAILIANILMILTIIAENGIGPYFSELTTLILTFADETGDIIVQAEVHELAFCLGAYLIYMLLKPRKSIPYFILLALVLFCFISAFKRIAILAIAAALGLGWLLKLLSRLHEKAAYRLTLILTVFVMVVLIGYIGLVKLGVFDLLEKAGVDTSGRTTIYRAVDRFYEFSPDFLGNGIGFLTYQLSSNLSVGVSAVHNDFLQYYIDLGFWGYLAWLFSMTIGRVWYFGRKGQTENGIIAFVLVLYLVIISSTDNTMNYPLMTTVMAMLMIGHGFDDKVRNTELKMFGSVSKENQKQEEESMI